MDPNPRPFRAAAQAAARVTQLAITVIFGTWAGAKLDGWLDTSPWLLFLGLFGGFAIGLYSMVRGLQELAENDDSD
jgi:F0F1-type ATP synthase assembly protein I